jgi:hypothetical protein
MLRPLSKLLLVPFLLITAGFGARLNAQEAHPSDLTANDLAEALSIHWWTIKLPPHLGPKAEVGVGAMTSDGKKLEGGGGFSGGNLGDKLRVYCWEDSTAHLMKVVIKLENGNMSGMYLKDYFKDAAVGGPSNGAVLNVGDSLIKFDASKSPSMVGGNAMLPGQTGLRVVIGQRP